MNENEKKISRREFLGRAAAVTIISTASVLAGESTRPENSGKVKSFFSRLMRLVMTGSDQYTPPSPESGKDGEGERIVSYFHLKEGVVQTLENDEGQRTSFALQSLSQAEFEQLPPIEGLPDFHPTKAVILLRSGEPAIRYRFDADLTRNASHAMAIEQLSDQDLDSRTEYDMVKQEALVYLKGDWTPTISVPQPEN